MTIATTRESIGALLDLLGRVPRPIRWLGWMTFATGVLILRRPTIVTRAEFFNEDGQVLFLGTYFGNPLEILVRSYQGYLLVVPRLVAFGERTVPIEVAPLLGNLSSLIVTTAVAGYIASGRLAGVLPGRWTRLTLAGLVLLLPGAFESLGSLAYVQWYLGIWLLLAAYASAPSSRVGRWVERLALLLAGLTGPFSVMASPVYLWRAARTPSPERLWRAAIVGGSAAVQVILLVTSDGRAERIHWSGVLPPIAAGAFRGIYTPLIGTASAAATASMTPVWPIALVALGLVGTLAIITFASVPRAIRTPIAFGFIVSLAAGILGSTDSPQSMFDPWSSQRYFVIPGAFLASAVVLSLTAGRRPLRLAAVPLAVLLIIGIAVDFRLPPRAGHGWADHAGCIGKSAPCVVPVEPPDAWSIRWPGPNGPYVQGHAGTPASVAP